MGCSRVTEKSVQSKNFLELDDFLSARDLGRPQRSLGLHKTTTLEMTLIDLDDETILTEKLRNVNKDWDSWNAIQHDAAIREEQVLGRRKAVVDEGPVLKQVYKRTQVNDGRRVTVEIEKKKEEQSNKEVASLLDAEIDESECSDLIEF
jgi:hypothetical protein